MTKIELDVNIKNFLKEARVSTHEDEDGKNRVKEFRDKYFEKKNDKFCFKDALKQKKYSDFLEIYKEFEKLKSEQNKYTFDDMILEVLTKIQEDRNFLGWLQESYQYILVDEFQDSNGSQIAILESLADNPVFEGSPEIMVVGDPDQAIYRFQGASNNNIQGFLDRYPKAVKVEMYINYRSTPSIVDTANKIIHKSNNRIPKADIVAHSTK